MSEGEQRLLAAMPMHAVAALHGEAGLRERFAIEIASTLLRVLRPENPSIGIRGRRGSAEPVARC